jgi:DNA-binding response OmpR family regulator
MQTTTGDGPTVLVADEDAPARAFIADLNGSTLALVDELAAAAVPTIVLAHAPSGDQWHAIRALERGCDDYVRKPFSYGELLGRIRALLRRAATRSPAVLTLPGLVIDIAGRGVTVDGRRVNLTPIEFALLHALAVRPDAIVTSGDLLRNVWGWQTDPSETRVVSVTAYRLRRKLGPGYVQTVHGHGLRLLPTPSER